MMMMMTCSLAAPPQLIYPQLPAAITDAITPIIMQSPHRRCNHECNHPCDNTVTFPSTTCSNYGLVDGASGTDKVVAHSFFGKGMKGNMHKERREEVEVRL